MGVVDSECLDDGIDDCAAGPVTDAVAEAARAERLAREARAVEAQGGKDTVVAGCAIVKKGSCHRSTH